VSRYAVSGPTPVLDHEPGATFEHEFTADEEHDLLERGRLTLETSKYRNIGDHDFVTDDGAAHEPGETFDAALRVGRERALLDGGHLEKVETRQRAAKTKKEQ
jgi:hypothetical protein